MAAANTELVLDMSELKYCLPQIYKALLTGSCLSNPNDPIQFLKNALVAFQGHDNLQTFDWYKFVADAEQLSTPTDPAQKAVSSDFMDTEDNMVSIYPLERALSFYRKNVTRSCFRKWKRFITQSRRETTEMALKMDMTKRHFERKCQHTAFIKWWNWVKLCKTRKAAGIDKLESLVNNARLRRILAAWHIVAKDSKRTKEYFKMLEMSLVEIGCEDHEIREGYDGVSSLPSCLLLKIFQYLQLRDRLNCAEVCCIWKSIIQSGTLWSQINFSTGKDWITDCRMKEILQNYRPFVIHLNLRGCSSLNWPSLKFISECKNLQELNVSECFNLTDTMVQRLVEGCPCLLYLNLSCTFVTNKTLKELSRSCISLQYLSLAYCCRFTDKGFLYLTTGKGCRNLIHLNLSGCTQITLNGFRHISVGCPSLREVVINDMPTLTDGCILALLARCRCLSSVSLLDAPHLSDITLKAIAEAAKLKSFLIEGNNQLTDGGWKALCSSSKGLCRLHTAGCPRITDQGLRSVATLKNLQYLDISLCSRVSDVGIQYLVDGCSANKLHELNVSHCPQITDISVRRIAQRLCKLYHLNLSYCGRLTNLAVEGLSGSSVCSLDITGCNIEDQGLAALEKIHLRKIVLAECLYVTDIGIEKLCKNARDLEVVDVSHCVALSDAAIRAISFYCRGLVTLQMSWCPKMTDMAVQYLTIGSQYLQELDVSGCTFLTDRTPRHLERICPPLASIKMNCCRGISRAAAIKLQTRVSYWEHSSDDPSYWFVSNMNKIGLPITRSFKTVETWEETAKHSFITCAVSTSNRFN
ncbi:F-box and leucine-rich repeat protein 13 [Menidia menidia]